MLQEHKVCAQRFLRRVGILDVPFTRFPRFTLCGAERILAFDGFRCECALPGSELALSSLFRGLGPTSEGLKEMSQSACKLRRGGEWIWQREVSVLGIGCRIGAALVTGARGRGDKRNRGGKTQIDVNLNIPPITTFPSTPHTSRRARGTHDGIFEKEVKFQKKLHLFLLRRQVRVLRACLLCRLCYIQLFVAL